MLHRLTLASRFTLLALLPLAAGNLHAQPDLSGIWQLASRPMTSAQGYPPVPLTPLGQEKVDTYRSVVDPLGETPTLWCVSHGMPEMMMGGGSYPLEIIQQPNQVTIISEWLSETRRIFLGELQADDDAIFPSRQGYSKGHWEGDILVVETTHLQEMVDSRYPHSTATTITERFSLSEDPDGTRRLVADTVVNDPQWLTEPLNYRLEWTPSAFSWVQPYECMEELWLQRLRELEAAALSTDAISSDAESDVVTASATN
ncbi:MAG TPA: hypothetical protein GX696_05295 [Pseudomonadaceae bacterium]|nr:hypothetical protein [Pseudomonadaceae bacterium]